MIEIELPDILTGETLKLSDYKGHVIYLDFWASWCQPCRTSMPVMELMQAEFSEEKFKVFAVNLDDERKLGIEMMNELSVTFTNVWDEKKRMPDAYEIPGMPSAYLIDKQGNIRLVHKGFKKSDTEKIKRAISILLHEKERE